MADPLQTILMELASLEAAGLRRRMRPIDSPQRSEITVDGRAAINFSSNNYLGLADDPLLADAARAALEGGFGSGASRLIVGSLPAHRALEARVAEWQGTDAALLFNSGYHANVGLVSALAGPEDVVFSDALNHASLIDGCRLSHAQVVVYRHRDLDDLRAKLRAGPPRRRRLVITDSLFSMDGDTAPLEDLRALTREHDALLAIDDAHAVGVFGARGAGLAPAASPDVRMGTFGKALGGFGAFVAASRPVIELLANRARSFVFTTALPVPVAAVAHAAIDWLATDPGAERRARLASRSERFHAGLRARALPAPPAPSHIVPLAVAGGNPRTAMEASEALLARGIYAQGIRPPTVPPGTARLRFALMATHTDAHLDHALDALAELHHHFARP